jgi:hypothetical protein
MRRVTESIGIKAIWAAASVATAILAGVAAADAQSAKGRQTENERLLAAAVAATNAACGSAIAVKLAHGPATEAAQRDNSARSCRQAFEGIRNVCKTQAARAAVSAQIKRVNCIESSKGPDVSLDRGVLDYLIEPSLVSNFSQMVFLHLMSHLDDEGQPLFVHVLKPLEEEELANHIARTNRTCGTSVTVRFDWTGVPVQEIKSRSASNYCGHALDSVERVCADRAGKEAVAKQIKRVVCGYSAERSVSLENGVLVFKSDFQASSDRRSFLLEYLQNAL